MKVYTEVLGNIHTSEEWMNKFKNAEADEIYLDQWTAQKSRFLSKGVSGEEYPVALTRGSHIVDGDVIEYDPEAGRIVVVRLELNPVLVVDLAGIADKDHDTIIRIALELGHAIGNQHWPAVVKGTKVYVPLTVDKKVMLSVLETHHIPGITFEFEKGLDVIPYLAPHETRRLFGGAGHESHSHEHSHPHSHFHEHSHGEITHSHQHSHDDGDFHNHSHHEESDSIH